VVSQPTQIPPNSMEEENLMAATTVWGCDWCGDIVPKRQSDDQPQFAAHVTIKAGMAITQTDHDICAQCLRAFNAIKEGKYRR
jgi:hypothetical protein